MTLPAHLGRTQCSVNPSSLLKHHFSLTISTARAIASVAVPASYLNTPIPTPPCLKLTRARQNVGMVVSRRYGNRLVTWVSSELSYCIDTTYSSGQVTHDVLGGIENSSKPWRTHDETQNLSLQDKNLRFLVVLKPPRREKFLSRSSNLVGTCDIRPISSLRRRLWRVTRRVGRIIAVYTKVYLSMWNRTKLLRMSREATEGS